MDVTGGVMLPVVAAGVYRDELAQGLLSFKRHGQNQLGRRLGRALGSAVQAAARGGSGVVLIPVPTSTAAYVKRGFSPVHLLLEEVHRQVPGFDVADVLCKTTASGRLLAGGYRGLAAQSFWAGQTGAAGQKGLGRGARSRRVRGSMRVKSRPRVKVAGRPCIIVDDVLTTGATLAEAARALHRAGALVRGAVVLAATRPPDALYPGDAAAAAHGSSHDLEKNKPGKDE